MLSRVQKSMKEKDEGFTLIELLVVIIIIGILAAIAIPVFLNQRKKAVDTSIKSDLRTVANEMETYYTDLQTYPAVAASSGAASGNAVVISSSSVFLSNGNVVTTALNTGGTAYCLKGTNAKGTDTTNGYFYISSKGGLQPAGTTACGTY